MRTITLCTAQKMKFSIKDFFSKCDQIFTDLLFTVTKTFTEKIIADLKETMLLIPTKMWSLSPSTPQQGLNHGVPTDVSGPLNTLDVIKVCDYNNSTTISTSNYKKNKKLCQLPDQRYPVFCENPCNLNLSSLISNSPIFD